MRRSIPVTRRVGGMSCRWYGGQRLTISGKAIMGLMAALLLAAISAHAVECASHVLNTVTVTACRVDLVHEQLQLFCRDDTAQPYARFSSLRDAWPNRAKPLDFPL